MSARNADSGLMHKFSWKWNLADLDSVKKNGASVFSCFSCGGVAAWVISWPDIQSLEIAK